MIYFYREDLKDVVAVNAKNRLGSLENVRNKAINIPTIPEGAEVRIVPHIPGFQFNPTAYVFNWFEDFAVHEFRLRAQSENPEINVDSAVNGEISVFVESVLIGVIPVAIYISEDAQPVSGSEFASSDPKWYRNVFVSYSHVDEEVIDRVTAAARTLGLKFIRDQVDLRSGEDWSTRLLEMIDDADVFQLYWSGSASKSIHVEQEWRHALGLQRPYFIRPLYWEKPMPSAPTELSDLHFDYYALGRQSDHDESIN